jgi:hypothetical protein
MAGFDLTRARRDGHSDAEIVDFLAGQRNFDAAKARADGYTDRDMLSFLMRPPERSTGERVARGAAMPFAGFNESLATTAGALPDLVSRGMRAVGLPTPEAGYYTDLARRGLRAVTGEPPKPETTTEAGLYGAGRGAGDAAAIMVPGAAVTRLAPAGSVTAGVGNAIAAQPGMQALAGAVGGGVAEMTDSPLAGAAAALAVPAARAVAARALQPVQSQLTPEARRALAVADAEGIPTTAGQRTGSRALQNLEASFETMPLTSGPQGALRAEQQTAFNRAALSRAGITADAATPDVLKRAQRQIGGEIGAIAGRTTAQVTPAIDARITALGADVAQFADADVARIVGNRVAQLQAKISNGTLPGRTARELDSALARQIRGAQSGDLKTRLIELRDILHDAIRAGATGNDAAAFDQARRQYANLVVLENAAGGAGTLAARGDISPAQLRMALSQSVGRRGYATGQGDLNDVVRAGEQFVRPQIPNSGSPERSLWQAALTGGGIGGGAGAAVGFPGTGAAIGAANAVRPRVVQAAYNTPFIQNWLANGASRSVDAPTRNAMLSILAAQGKGALAER